MFAASQRTKHIMYAGRRPATSARDPMNVGEGPRKMRYTVIDRLIMVDGTPRSWDRSLRAGYLDEVC